MGKEKRYDPIFFGQTWEHYIRIYVHTCSIRWLINDKDIKYEYIRMVKDDEKTKEFIKHCQNFENCYEVHNLNLLTNMGLSFRCSFDGTIGLLIDFSDDNPFCSNTLSKNFSYSKDSLQNRRTFNLVNQEVKSFLNEEIIGKMYANLKVDISQFSKEFQEEIRQAQIALKAHLSEAQDKEIQEAKKIQLDRIMKAYQLLKEAMELLSLAKADMGFERIKLDNISFIIFKNGGLPNSEGYIEIDDVFRNNMILRMLDLSEVDLTNVDIRGMDFSGTNIHIDPQRIYNKDMTNVNATDVGFSPFTDSFDGVILDGAIINDYEASIHLDRVKSYDARTIIKSDVVKTFAR